MLPCIVYFYVYSLPVGHMCLSGQLCVHVLVWWIAVDVIQPPVRACVCTKNASLVEVEKATAVCAALL